MTIQCNCESGGRCEIHPKPKLEAVPKLVNTAVDVVPQIEATDKLTLKTLEAESLKAQIEMDRARQQVMQKAMMAHQQLEQFVAAMFEKHGLKQSEWVLDLAKLEFVAREVKP